MQHLTSTLYFYTHTLCACITDRCQDDAYSSDSDSTTSSNSGMSQAAGAGTTPNTYAAVQV
jgi:hypothetical protein